MALGRNESTDIDNRPTISGPEELLRMAERDEQLARAAGATGPAGGPKLREPMLTSRSAVEPEDWPPVRVHPPGTPPVSVMQLTPEMIQSLVQLHGQLGSMLSKIYAETFRG